MGRLSTTCNGNYGSHYYLYLDYDINSQSIDGNYSNITLSMWAQSDSSSYGAYNLNSTNPYSITLNGSNVVSSTKAMDFRGRAVVSLGSWTGNVGHNSDGSLSINIGGSFSIGGTSSLTGGYISGSWTLPTIPRASSVALYGFTIGDNIRVTFDRKSSSFTQNISLYVNGTWICERTGIQADSYTLTLNETEQDRIYKVMPSSITSTATLYCATLNGGTQIGGTTSDSASVTIPSSVVPTIGNVIVTETDTNVNSIVGKFVQNLSKLKVDIIGASGVKYSTISNYSIKIYSPTLTTSIFQGQSVMLNPINANGNITVEGTVTDSRGISVTKTTTINLMPYSFPKATAFTLQRCDSDGKLNVVGTYVKVTSAGSVSSLVNSTEKNMLTYSIYTRLRGSTDWGTAKKTATISGLSLNTSDILGTYGANSAYDFRLDIKDKFNTTITLSVLSTSLVTMSWGNNGVGIGKVWERGALDVNGDICSNGSFNKGGWNAPTKGALTQVIDSSGSQHSVIVGVDSSNKRYYGIDLLDNITSPVMRLYAGSKYFSLQSNGTHELTGDLITTGKITSTGYEIAEAGVNSNGRYVKFYNGIAIAYKGIALGDLDFSSLAINNIYYSTAFLSRDYISFPITFYEIPETFINIASTGYMGCMVTNNYLDKFRARAWAYYGGLQNSVTLSYVAIGRWKA